METLRNTIKTLAAQQVELKNQRKTVYRVGPEIIYPYLPDSYQFKHGMGGSRNPYQIHLQNREKLRLLYATQGLLKGRTLEEIEPHNKVNTIPLSSFRNQLDKLVAEYAIIRVD